jgi:MFS family permease
LILYITPAYVLTFLGYVLCGPANAWLIFVLWALAGVGDGAFGVVLNSALYATSPDTSKRKAYFAVYNLVLLLASSAGAFIAVGIAEALKGHSLRLGPFVLGQFHLLFAGCCLFFIVIFLFSIPLMPGKPGEGKPTPGANSTAQ